ncbi:MAG: hypothetical protein V3W44_10130 [Dehalococcoidales bacterium]
MGTFHSLLVGSGNHAITANPNTAGTSYADIAARDADSDFNTNSANLDKVVRVESPLSYYILTSIVPTWLEFTSTTHDEWTELLDTPSSISAGLAVQGNSAGDALEFGQALDTTDSPTFAALTVTGAINNATLFDDLTLLNLLVGFGTGVAITSASGTTAVGHQALAAVIDGDANTAVGFKALTATTTGTENTAVGDAALIANTVGSNNDALGHLALGSNTTGSNNTALGASALENNTTGADNIAIGVSALDSNILGRRNIVIGTGAGFNMVPLVSTGENTLLGYNTGLGITTGVQNTILGANVVGLTATLSNNIILADGAGAIRLQFDSSGDSVIGGDFLANNVRNYIETRTLPIVIDDFVEIAVFGLTFSGFNLDLAVTVSSTNFSVAKRYLVTVQFDGGADGVFETLLPISNTGAFGGNDFDVELAWASAHTATFRIRRTVGTMAGTATIHMQQRGSPATTFTALTGTGSTTAPANIWESTPLTQINGAVGVGLPSPSAKLHILETTEQLRLAYDATNFASFTVSSGGDLTIAPTGGDLAITAILTATRLRTGAGTELLPAYAFTSNTNRGMYDAGSSLRLVDGGFDVLELVTVATSTSFLKITNTDASSLDITLVPDGADANVSLTVNAKGTGEVEIGTSGAVIIGFSTGVSVGADGFIALGRFGTGQAVVDGTTVGIKAATPSFTKTSLQIKSPLGSSDLLIGINNPLVNNGDAFITAEDTTELVLSTSSGEAIGISGQNVTILGNLNVLGTTTTIDSTTLLVEDKNITLGNVTSPTDITAEGGGISLLGTTTKTFNWVGSTAAWTSSQNLNLLTGFAYLINGASVLSGSTLGSGVLNSSLTGVGALNSGSITSGFGSINIGASTFDTTGLATLGSLRVTGTIADTSGDVGTSGQLLSSTVTGTTWVDPSNVTISGTPVDNQLAIWTGPTTIEGDSGLTYDGTDLTIAGGLIVDTDTLIVDATNNRVGIGLTDPDNALHVSATGSLQVGAKNDVVGTRLIISPTGSMEMTFGLNDGSATTQRGRFLVLFNSGTTIEAGNDTGGYLTRTNGGAWGAMVGGTAGELKFFTGGTSTNQVYDAMSATFAMIVDDSQNVGIGTQSPSAKLHSLATTEQLRLGFDDNNYAAFTVDDSYDVSTASYDSVSFSVTSQDTNPRDVTFNADGTRMFVAGNTNSTIYQYDLTVAFDLTTASYNSVSKDVSAEETNITAVAFNADGTSMYIVGQNTDTVYQYTLTSGFDLSTATFASISFSVATQETAPTCLEFNSDGSKMFVLGFFSQGVNQYTLSTPFNVSTASFDSLFSTASEDISPQGLAFSADGTRMFVQGDLFDTIFQYSLTTAFDSSTASYDNISFSVASEDGDGGGIRFNNDGTKLYLVGGVNDSVFQYSIDSGGLIVAPTAGNTTFSSPKADTAPVMTLESTGTNMGVAARFVGSRNPNGNVTGAGGGEYVRDSGATSGSFENLSTTEDAVWFRRSLLTAEIIEINTSAQFEEQATASVIAIADNEDLVNTFNITPGFTATVYTLTGTNANLRLTEGGYDNFIVSVNPGTLITGTNGGIISIERIGLITFAGGTLFDYTGTSLGNVLGKIQIGEGSVFSSWKMGSVSRDSTSEIGPLFNADSVAFVNWTDTLTADGLTTLNLSKCFISQRTGSTTSKPFLSVINTAYKPAQVSLRDNFGTLLAGESLLRVDAGLPNTHKVIVTGHTIDLAETATLFDTSGSTGDFTAVDGDNSISTTAITSVTDNGGVAVFHHVGTSPPLGSLVTVFGFSTNTAYNTTGIVTFSTTFTFEIDYVAFGTTETGSYLVDTLTITAAGHSVAEGEGVTLDCDLSILYDGGMLAFNIDAGVSFDVPGVFTTTVTGSWSTEGLDQTDIRVEAFNNPGIAPSHSIACGHVNNNVTANPTITNNVFTDMAFGTGGVGLSQSTTTERWKMTDAVNGTFVHKGLEPFDGQISFDFTVESSGGTVNFRFKWMKSIDTTITASTISFTDDDPETILDSADGFLDAGFAAEDRITVSGSTSNDGSYIILSVTAGVISLVAGSGLVIEAAGASVTIDGDFGNLPDAVESLVAVGSDAQSVTKTFPLIVGTGVSIKPQITRNSGSSNITAIYATIFATATV